jgi:dienelactone hydrolase
MGLIRLRQGVLAAAVGLSCAAHPPIADAVDRATVTAVSLDSADRLGSEISISIADGQWVTARLFLPAGMAMAASTGEPPERKAAADAAPPLRGAVVALHGCGGLYAASSLVKNPASKRALSARHRVMAEKLTQAGYAVVFPDSLTARGETELCTQKLGSRRVTQIERRTDALATLAWVKSQPWGARTMVAALGWSHGGSAVLAATDARSDDVKASRYAFDTAIAFYPGCADRVKGRAYTPTAPLTILVGELDDWTPAAPCQLLAQKTGASITIFEGSHHGFDAPSGTVRLRADVPNGAQPGAGVHVGPNPIAGALAHRQLMEVLDLAAQRVVAQRPSSGFR